MDKTKLGSGIVAKGSYSALGHMDLKILHEQVSRGHHVEVWCMSGQCRSKH